MKTILSLLVLATVMSINVQASEVGQRDSECIYTRSSLSRSASQNFVKNDAQAKQAKSKKPVMSK